MRYIELRKARAFRGLQEVVAAKGGIILSKYINQRTKISIRCGKGHEWEATPNSVKILGSWCPYCAGNAPLPLEDLRQTAAERGGECLATEPVNNCTKVRWRCKKGHEWESTYAIVKNQGSWCPHCNHEKGRSRNARKIREYVEALGGTLLSDYANCRTKVRIRCKKGHEWEATPHKIKYRGSWCPICRNKSENAVRTMLKYALELEFPPYSPKALEKLGVELRNTAGNRMHLDGFNLDICAAFEYHGRQHTDGGSYFHGHTPDSFQRRQKDDELKREQCERAGIVLFEVYEELHGVWPHLNMLYTGLLNVLEERGVHMTGKPNLSDLAWMQLVTQDRHQANLDALL